jgi:hypothetical protein
MGAAEPQGGPRQLNSGLSRKKLGAAASLRYKHFLWRAAERSRAPFFSQPATPSL